MWKKIVALILIATILLLTGCAAHIHKIGAGAQGNDIQEARQWYALWGLVPINDVDSSLMAEGATNYEITTSTTVLDFVISIFTGIVTINSRTVVVQK